MPFDIATAIFLTLYALPIFNAEFSPSVLLFAIVCALLPDIDMVPYVLRAHHRPDHRSFTHYPAVYLPLALLASIFFDPLYATLFIAGVYLHLLHDTVGIGWGIAWLWPFTPRRFRFLSPLGNGQWELYTSWMPGETPAFERTNESWIQTYYLRPNPIGLVEYGALFVALIALYISFT